MRGSLHAGYLFKLSVFLLIFSALSFAAGPRAYLTESVSGDFFWNGTANGAATRTGVVEVWVPNTIDVLQYLRLNLTGNQSTNIVNNVTYNSVAASPTAGSRTVIYVNTSADAQASNYLITNANVAPAFVVSMNVSNDAGGLDLYDQDNNLGSSVNTLNFTVSIYNPSATANFTGLSVNMTFNQTAGPSGQDVLNVTTASISPSSGTVTRNDMDGDGYFENVRWSGEINATQTVTFTFKATMLEGTNYANNIYDVNLNGLSPTRGVRADWSNSTATLTSIGFRDLFTRGPVREGIDLAQDANGIWRVRGFVQNVANASGELVYTIHNWSLWNVSGGVPNNVVRSYTGAGDWQSALAPSDGATYTEWNTTGSTAKPYFAASFDWEVNWDTTQSNFTSSQINTTMRMQTLRQIDLQNAQAAITGILLPTQENMTITITDEVSHVGSTSISGGYINIYSVIPNQTTAGVGRYFMINASTINVYYYNGSDYRPLKIETGIVNYTYVNPSSAGVGYVNATVFVLSRANMTDTGDLVSTNLTSSSSRNVRLNFSLLSPADLQVGEEFSFNFNGTVRTESQTPIREQGNARTIMVATKRLLGYKDIRIPDPNNPTILNTTILIQITDKNGTGVAGIKFIDYLPNGTNITTAANIFDAYNKSLVVKLYNGSAGTWGRLSYGANYTITDLGWKTLGDGSVVYAFEINSTVTDGWTLYDGDQLEANYFMNITSPGLYVLPVVIAAFDPATGTPMDTSAVGFVKVTVPVSYKPAVITEGELEPAKTVIVGKPATWLKTFEVFNPNIRPLSAKFSASIFKDTMNAVVSYTTEAGEQKEELVEFETRDGQRYVTWDASLYPQETRTYTVRILTPPVIEVERKVADLSQMSEKLVKVSLDVYLKNLAEEDYRNVKLYLPVDNEKIFSVRDDSLNDLVHSSAGEGSSIITMDEVAAKQILTVSLQYKESYPVVIITTDKENYEAGNPVGLSILVINGGEKLSRPYVETEIYSPDLDLMYTSVQNMKPLKAIDQAEVKENFFLPNVAPTGNYLVSARFREDFATITQGNGKFYVVGASGSNFMFLGYLVILVFTIIVLYSSIKRIREIRENSRKFEQAQPYYPPSSGSS